MTQEQMQAVQCPSCGQPVGWPCHRNGREQATVCIKRRGVAEAMVGWREPGPTMTDRIRAHQRRWKS